MAIAYNASDPVQQRFLRALALGESGNVSNSTFLGFGGADLSGAYTDATGFPQWEGVGNTHAAGTYQFQPGTWAEVSKKYNLDFRKQEDQNAGAWYYAQQRYAQATGGDLREALESKNYSSVQNALREEWPSVMGNGANPKGLAGALAEGLGVNVTTASDYLAAQNATEETGTGFFGAIENWFTRFGLIVLGAIIIIAALWALLSDKGVVPSPMKVAKGLAP